MVLLLLLTLVGVTLAQEGPCECGFFIRDPITDVTAQAVDVFSTVTIPDQCDLLDCDLTCWERTVEFEDTVSLGDPYPDDPQGRTYGQVYCERAQNSDQNLNVHARATACALADTWGGRILISTVYLRCVNGVYVP